MLMTAMEFINLLINDYLVHLKSLLVGLYSVQIIEFKLTKIYQFPWPSFEKLLYSDNCVLSQLNYNLKLAEQPNPLA